MFIIRFCEILIILSMLVLPKSQAFVPLSKTLFANSAVGGLPAGPVPLPVKLPVITELPAPF